jgi:hypothetical protein
MSTTRWDMLRDAYGPATEIPALLDSARRAPPGRKYTDEPWFSLWSALCHQGDVYTASYAAVPELIAIAMTRKTDPAAAFECLHLAACIELERALPEGCTPPPMEGDFSAAYHASLPIGADIASVLLTGEIDPSRRRALTMAQAAFRGDVAEARRLEQLD